MPTKKALTTAEERKVDELVKAGKPYKQAIKITLTGTTNIRLFNKTTTQKLVNAVKQYERKHGIKN